MGGSLCTGHACGDPREGGEKLVYLKSCFPSTSCGKCAGLSSCYTTGYISTLGKLTPLEGWDSTAVCSRSEGNHWPLTWLVQLTTCPGPASPPPLEPAGGALSYPRAHSRCAAAPVLLTELRVILCTQVWVLMTSLLSFLLRPKPFNINTTRH